METLKLLFSLAGWRLIRRGPYLEEVRYVMSHLEHNIAVLPAASNISLALEVADLILACIIIYCINCFLLV